VWDPDVGCVPAAAAVFAKSVAFAFVERAPAFPDEAGPCLVWLAMERTVLPFVLKVRLTEWLA
jgi:hypothetical protein